MSPSWSLAFPLLEERVHPNVVVLPDGTAFICGGKEASATPPPRGGRCELYDPKTGTISEMDELNIPRHYHSVALLLPDARVMVAGGADDGGCTISTRETIEVFSPPYLFRGPRPVISSATGFVKHGATISIKTSTASDIQRVVLAHPSAVTHQTDSEQRVIPLNFQVTGPNTIEAQAPGGAGQNAIAPSGYYMLFILNREGVPSVSKWIHVGKLQDSQNGQALQSGEPDKEGARLVDMKGNRHSLREFSGRPHVVILIKGAFCKLCMEQLTEFQNRLAPSGIPIVVITPVDDLAELSDLPFSVFADPELSAFRQLKAFNSGPLHATYVFGAQGEVLLKDVGEEPYSNFAAVEKVLNVKSALSYNR
jgi:peroxiredoxin